MGTNYYWYESQCPTCGHRENEIHIGKSSAGWVFSLHVYPEDGIRDLEDWKDRFSLPGSFILDEYEHQKTPAQMLDTITNRGGDAALWGRNPPFGYSSWDQFLALNQAERGPNGLLRSVADRSRVVGHGSGTWDLVTGVFS